MGGGTTPTDPGPLGAWLTLRHDLNRVGSEDIDPELHAAVDAVLIAYRTASRWWLVGALIWVGYRAGVVVGRRMRRGS